jgi:GNAT superfamily N-acetyltransferase
MRFAVEPLSRWYLDAQPLFHAHWAEIGRHRDRFALDPDWRKFVSIEFEGRLFTVTARDAGQVVGYAVFVFGPHLHYRGMRTAVCDMIYLDPAYRAQGLAYRGFVAFCNERLAEHGAHIVLHRSKLSHPALGRILEHDGYTPIELVHEKVLQP